MLHVVRLIAIIFTMKLQILEEVPYITSIHSVTYRS